MTPSPSDPAIRQLARTFPECAKIFTGCVLTNILKNSEKMFFKLKKIFGTMLKTFQQLLIFAALFVKILREVAAFSAWDSSSTFFETKTANFCGNAENFFDDLKIFLAQCQKLLSTMQQILATPQNHFACLAKNINIFQEGCCFWNKNVMLTASFCCNSR